MHQLLHSTNSNFSFPTSIEEILDKPIFWNPHTKLDFTSDNLYFYCISPRYISHRRTIIRDLYNLQPYLFSSTTFNEKLGFPTASHKRIYKFIMDLIPNDWKHLLKTDTSQISILKTFYYNNTDTRRVEDFQKRPNKEIYFTFHG